MKRLCYVWAGLWLFSAPGVEADTGGIKRDFKNLITWENTAIVTTGMGFAGIAHRWDDDLVGEVERLSVFELTADPSNAYGSSTFNLPAALGLWLFSKALNRPKLEAVSSDLLRSLVYTQLLVGPIKHASRRYRPDGSNRLSFPSGHTANAFAIAGVLNSHFGPRVGIPFYAWSVLVAGARMEGNRHYLSDVIAGSAIGIVVGRSISRAGSERISILPVPLSKGMMITMTFRN